MRDASTILPFADGEYQFRMGWGELGQLQEACDVGPYVLEERLSLLPRAVRWVDGSFLGQEDQARALVDLDGAIDPPQFLPPKCTAAEIGEVIRCALVGGGLDPVKALKLVREHVHGKPIERNRPLAWTLMRVALYGAPEEELEKKAEAASPN